MKRYALLLVLAFMLGCCAHWSESNTLASAQTGLKIVSAFAEPLWKKRCVKAAKSCGGQGVCDELKKCQKARDIFNKAVIAIHGGLSALSEAEKSTND